MALFAAVAKVAEELAGEPGKLKKRAAIADAICIPETGATSTAFLPIR